MPELPEPWATQKKLAAENWGMVPEGHELTAVPDPDWEVDEVGRPCRRAFGRGTPACGKLSAAVLRRGERGQPWGYCPAHMYGRWIEGGQVMCWVLRPAAGG